MSTAAPAARQARTDAFANFTTGIGTFRDKATHTQFVPGFTLFPQQALLLHEQSDICRKVIEKRPKEYFREGYTLAVKGAKQTDLDKLQKTAKALDVDCKLRDAAIWGRAEGGCLALIGCDDGAMPDTPLREDNIRTIRSINVVDRRFAGVLTYYSDPFAPKLGEPEKYLITNFAAAGGGQSSIGSVVVHETRLLRFGGLRTEPVRRRSLGGWDLSVLQIVLDTVLKFEAQFGSVGHLVSDASQGVFKMQGLIDMITSNNAEELQTRMRLVDMSRSVAKAILLDADTEDFQRVTTNFSGLPDVILLFMLRLAAAVDMPMTELFGQSPKGMDATGESDTRKWYDTIRVEQKDELGPKLIRLYTLLSKAKDSPFHLAEDQEIEIHFKPLWQVSDKEQADTDFAIAQRDNIYIDQGVVTPEEVALERQDLYQSMDVAAREQAMKGAIPFEPYDNAPPEQKLNAPPPAPVAATGAVPPKGAPPPEDKASGDK